MCDATGTCTVGSIIPMANNGAVPYPYRQVGKILISAKALSLCSPTAAAAWAHSTALSPRAPAFSTHLIHVLQWFVHRLGDGSSVDFVPLATEALFNDNAALNTNPPGDITHAIKLMSYLPDDLTAGYAEPYIFWPSATQSGTYPRPETAPSGMFDGVSRQQGMQCRSLWSAFLSRLACGTPSR